MDLEEESYENKQGQSLFPEEEAYQSEKKKISPTLSPNVKKYIYTKTKSFWLQKLTHALSKTTLSSLTPQPTSPPPITEVIKDGLELQDYMQKYTHFFRLYLQQIKPEYVQYNIRKKRFVQQDKIMLRIFVQKNKNAIEYFYEGVDWVEQRLSSYSYVVDEKLCIRTVMERLVRNKYEKQEDFFLDMGKMFDDSLLFNFNNERMRDIILRLKENWQATKLKVLQLYNFGTRLLINPDTQMQPQMIDINAEINILKRKVSIWNSKVEELDYDPMFFDKQQGEDRVNNLMSRESQESKRKEQGVRKRGRPKFESGQKRVEKVSRERMLKFKLDLSKRISEEFQSNDKSKKKLILHINEKAKRNPNFLGQDNEIDLENLSLEEFIQLETFLSKILEEED